VHGTIDIDSSTAAKTKPNNNRSRLLKYSVAVTRVYDYRAHRPVHGNSGRVGRGVSAPTTKYHKNIIMIYIPRYNYRYLRRWTGTRYDRDHIRPISIVARKSFHYNNIMILTRYRRRYYDDKTFCIIL